MLYSINVNAKTRIKNVILVFIFIIGIVTRYENIIIFRKRRFVGGIKTYLYYNV